MLRFEVVSTCKKCGFPIFVDNASLSFGSEEPKIHSFCTCKSSTRESFDFLEPERKKEKFNKLLDEAEDRFMRKLEATKKPSEE